MTQGSRAWWHGSAATITLEVSRSAWHWRLSISFIALAVALWGGLLLHSRSPFMLIPCMAAVGLGIVEWRSLGARRELTLIVDSARALVAILETERQLRISGALCLPWLVVLWCRPVGSRRHLPGQPLLIWRDSVTAAHHRGLRRWLRQREFQGEADTTGSG